ncbi:MAG: hypothetical protein RBS35_06305 [Azonexus sp.]|jgi:hypothetical protein|nr:hypothetical protein [Azonexus sp.]
MVKVLAFDNDTQVEQHGDSAAPPVDEAVGSPSAVLTDEQLRDAGFDRVAAWLRSDLPNKTRKARNLRYREKQAANGYSQVSLRIPMEMGAEFKNLAKQALETGKLQLPETTLWLERAEKAESTLTEVRQQLALSRQEADSSKAHATEQQQEIELLEDKLAASDAMVRRMKWEFRIFGVVTVAILLFVS